MKGKRGVSTEIVPGLVRKGAQTYFISCRLTGKECLCTEDRLQALLEKFDTYEEVVANYEWRDATFLVEHGIRTRTEIKQMFNVKSPEKRREREDQLRQLAKAERKNPQKATKSPRHKIPPEMVASIVSQSQVIQKNPQKATKSPRRKIPRKKDASTVKQSQVIQIPVEEAKPVESPSSIDLSPLPIDLFKFIPPPVIGLFGFVPPQQGEVFMGSVNQQVEAFRAKRFQQE